MSAIPTEAQWATAVDLADWLRRRATAQAPSLWRAYESIIAQALAQEAARVREEEQRFKPEYCKQCRSFRCVPNRNPAPPEAPHD
jgi:hypothetical protein